MRQCEVKFEPTSDWVCRCQIADGNCTESLGPMGVDPGGGGYNDPVPGFSQDRMAYALTPTLSKAIKMNTTKRTRMVIFEIFRNLEVL